MLYGHVDEPPSQSQVRESPLVVRGWHRWGAQPALAVVASISGRVLGVAHVGSEMRPDVAKSTGNPSLIGAGWELSVDLGDLPPGPVLIDLSVWGALTQEPVSAGSVEVHVVDGDDEGAGAWAPAPSAPPDRFFASIDLPVDDEVSGEVLRVVGFALTEPNPVTSLDVRLNGRSVGRARLGLERPGLWRHHRVPHASIAGFEHLVELPADVQRSGKAKVEIVARTAEAGPVIVASRSWDVKLGPAEPCGDSDAPGEHMRVHDRPLGSPCEASQERLHLAAFTHDMGYGGGQLWLTELLAKAGAGDAFDCTIVTTKDGPLSKVMRDRGISVHVTQPFPLDDALAYRGRVEELCGWLRQQGCSAALANTFLTFPGADAALQADLPVVWAIHESWTPTAIWSVAYPEGWVDPLVRKRAEAVLRGSHAMAFEADATRQQYEAAAGPGRTVVVPYGIDVAQIEHYCQEVSREAARQKLAIPDDRRVLLVMGTTEPRKAQTLLAEAFRHVAGNHREASLVMVGDTGTPYADALRAYVERAGLSRQVQILPVAKEIYPWYRAADALVCASDVESLPRSVLEAMGFGLPVLATAVFGLPELIEDGQTGFLFEPSDLLAAVDALERVLSAPSGELAAVAARARELVCREYDSTGYAADFLALVQGLRRDRTALPSDILIASGRRSGG